MKPALTRDAMIDKFMKKLPEDVRVVVNELQAGIEESQDDPDTKSWGYEQGIILTVNEAQKILDFLFFSHLPIIAKQPCPYCGCNKFKEEPEYNECVNCHERF